MALGEKAHAKYDATSSHNHGKLFFSSKTSEVVIMLLASVWLSLKKSM